MEITEVRVFLKEGKVGDNKLKAFVTVTFDDMFVVRDLKIIDGKKGLFVAMPSVKVSVPCPKCRKKNPIRSKFCNECGVRLEDGVMGPAQKMSPEAQREEHRDIAHPINTETRDYIQQKVLEFYEIEKNKESTGERVEPSHDFESSNDFEPAQDLETESTM